MTQTPQAPTGFRCTADGAIDYQYYIDRGRRLRSDAFLESSAATIRLAGQMWTCLATRKSGGTRA